MTKTDIILWFIEYKKEIKEATLFITMGTIGTIIKILKFVNTGSKVTISFIITEILMSILVGSTVYGIFDQFLNCSMFITCIVAAWCSSFSTIFHDRLKQLLEMCFDFIPKFLKIK